MAKKRKHIQGSKFIRPNRGTDLHNALFHNDYGDNTCSLDLIPVHPCAVDLPGSCVVPHVNILKGVSYVERPVINIAKLVEQDISQTVIEISKGISILYDGVKIDIEKLIEAFGDYTEYPADYEGYWGITTTYFEEPIDFYSGYGSTIGGGTGEIVASVSVSAILTLNAP